MKINNITRKITNEEIIQQLQEWLIEQLSQDIFTEIEQTNCWISKAIKNPGNMLNTEFEKLINDTSKFDNRIVCLPVYPDRRIMPSQWGWDDEPTWMEANAPSVRFVIYFSKDPHNKYLNSLREKVKYK